MCFIYICYTHIDDLREILENVVLKEHKFKKFDAQVREHYTMTHLIPRWKYFERLLPTTYGEGVYFSSGRLTWLDYSIFDMLESNCNFLDYRGSINNELLVLPTSMNCTTFIGAFPMLEEFYSEFKTRLTISEYLNSERRFEYGPPFW